MKGKKVLVTGAAGFIGANLVRKLLKSKADLHILVRPISDLWRINDLLKNLTVHHYSSKNLKKQLTQIKPHIIFHLATHGGYPSQRDTQRVVETNLFTTINLLMATRDIPYEAFINTGTSSEYGYKQKPMHETDFLEPATYYAATKAGATLFAQTMAKLARKPIVTLRLFSVYGPWEEPTRLIPTVIRQALNHNDIAITIGKEVRDFVYVDDVIDAYLLTAKKASRLAGKIFNIGSGKQWTVEEVVQTIVRLTKSQSPIHQGQYHPRSWDTHHWLADTTQARKVLGWKAKTSFTQGLKKTVDWWLKYES